MCEHLFERRFKFARPEAGEKAGCVPMWQGIGNGSHVEPSLTFSWRKTVTFTRAAISKIAYGLSQNPNSSYTEFREEYLVLHSKRGILERNRARPIFAG